MKLFMEQIEVGKDTGKYRIVKKIKYESGEEKETWFEPQKESKFLWFKFWEPFTYPSYDFIGDIDKPYSLNTISEAIEIIRAYKALKTVEYAMDVVNSHQKDILNGIKNEVVYEERN